MNPQNPSAQQPNRPSRRKVLTGLGVGAAAVSVPSAVGAAARQRGRGRPDRDRPPRQADAGSTGTPPEPGPQRFVRLFDDHPPFQEADDDLRRQLVELGAPGGLLDANDPLDAGPVELITDLSLSANNPNNLSHTAGVTFLGQFLDHDITHDAGSRLGRPTSLRRSTNLRTAEFDLDSVYGGGPDESRELYEADDRFRFRVESGGRFEDLPRDDDGVALIGDGRNDENLIISQLHVAFLLFHNAVYENERGLGVSDELAFHRARQIVPWHYQWIIVNHFLPQVVGQELVDDILQNGRRFYQPEVARIPVEFQTSAYRFGHAMIRPSYRANLAGDDGDPFFGFVFDPSQFGEADPNDLSGGHRAPRRFIGWQTFFDFGDGEVKPNKQINTTMSSPLFNLPLGVISTGRGEPIGPSSLATRNLLRHITWGIPSGQDVAQAMGEVSLGASNLRDIESIAPRLSGNTPLWLYILREAEVMAGGQHLGPVGGRIVAEVFLGLLALDRNSYLNADTRWVPTVATRTGSPESFDMVDLLTIAGVDPVSRGE